MASVTYKYRTAGYKYHQCTEEIDLPKNQYGFTLVDDLREIIKRNIAAIDKGGILIWHRVNQKR